MSLPDETFRGLEDVRRGLGASRSAVVTEAIQEWLRRRRELSEAERRYIDGYARHPETAEDVAGSEALAVDAVTSWDPWE